MDDESCHSQVDAFLLNDKEILVAMETLSESTETIPTAPPAVRQQRLFGLDVARGIAIIGMMTDHIINPTSRPFDLPFLPVRWDAHVAGSTQLLFAVIIGVSMALMAGGQHCLGGVAYLQVKMKIIVRALLIFAIGGILVAFPTSNVGVILEYLAVAMLLALPALRVQPGRLAKWVLPIFVVAMVTVALAQNLSYRGDLGASTSIGRLLWMGQYPGLRWAAFVMLGLVIGRLALTDRSIQLWLLISGAAMMAAFGVGGLLAHTMGSDATPLSTDIGRWDFSRVFLTGGEARTFYHYGLYAGLAVAIIATCLLVTPYASSLFRPLAAAGSMALSLYVGHVVTMNWINPHITPDNQYPIFSMTVVIALSAATVWQLTLGIGPVERLVRFVSDRAVRIA